MKHNCIGKSLLILNRNLPVCLWNAWKESSNSQNLDAAVQLCPVSLAQDAMALLAPTAIWMKIILVPNLNSSLCCSSSGSFFAGGSQFCCALKCLMLTLWGGNVIFYLSVAWRCCFTCFLQSQMQSAVLQQENEFYKLGAYSLGRLSKWHVNVSKHFLQVAFSFF